MSRRNETKQNKTFQEMQTAQDKHKHAAWILSHLIQNKQCLQGVKQQRVFKTSSDEMLFGNENKTKSRRKTNKSFWWGDVKSNMPIQAGRLHVTRSFSQVISECLVTACFSSLPTSHLQGQKRKNKIESSACKSIRSRRAQWSCRPINGSRRWKRSGIWRPGAAVKPLKNPCLSFAGFSQAGKESTGPF